MGLYSVDNANSYDISIPGVSPGPQGTVKYLDLPPTSYNNLYYVDPSDETAFLAALNGVSGVTVRTVQGSGGLDNTGAIAEAILTLSTNPTANDTVVIGASTYKFVASLTAAAAQVQVLIGGNVAASQTNLKNAINGDATSKGTTWVEATTAAAEKVLASVSTNITNGVIIQNATNRGGTAVPGTQSIAVSKTLTHTADVWNVTNLNASAVPAGGGRQLVIPLTVTAAMITAGYVSLSPGFTPKAVGMAVFASTGVLRATTDAIKTVDTSRVEITLAGGASPAIQAGDTALCFITG